MGAVKIVLVCSLFTFVSTKSAHNGRQERLFRYGYSHTKAVIQPFVVKSTVPSSCVHVEATLPPCRSVRFLGNFPGFGSSTSENTTNVTASESFRDDEIQTTPLSWGEYLGFSAPTVTVNVTKVTTTTLINPNITVTFSLKGCRPSELPFGLERCSIEPTPTTLPIVPTSTVNSVSNNKDTNNQETNNNQLQGSQADLNPVAADVPTNQLNDAGTT